MKKLWFFYGKTTVFLNRNAQYALVCKYFAAKDANTFNSKAFLLPFLEEVYALRERAKGRESEASLEELQDFVKQHYD